MQKLLLSLLFSLVCSSTSFAQGDCLGYDYLIDLNGFACGKGLGQICFVTSADWVNYNDCGEYVIELEYETGHFIYTDLGDFYLHSETQDLTVLRHQPNFISEGLTIGCLEGVLQVPGTVFTIRVVWPDNPNDVIATSTFTLDGSTTIGGPGQTTLLSDAIDNGDLLDETIAAAQGQSVVIEGTLIVDQDYLFGVSPGGIKNEIVLKPGARIEVGTSQNGFNFGTWHANLHGCDGTWDRILLRPGSHYSGFYTRISDAAVAVELQDQSSINIGIMYMDKNGIGIASFGPNLKNIDINLFTSIFEGITIQGGQEGCHFENTSLIDLTGNLLIKNMSANGVYLDRADMIGYRNYYSECQIGVNLATSNNLLSLDRCQFDHGVGGVLSMGSAELEVTNCFFNDLEYGIGRTSSIMNEHTLVEDNVMADCEMDVMAFVQSSRAEIMYNELAANRTNVLVWGLDPGPHKWAVQHNFAMYAGLDNNSGYNVAFLNVHDGRIFKNTYPLASFNNFAVWGGSDVKIGYNTDAVSFADNIRVTASPNGLIYCNTMDGNTGLTFMNTCSGTIVRGNEMTGSNFNLSYGTPNSVFASTGPQHFKGNKFDLSSEGNQKAVNYSLEQVAQLNQYLAGFLSGAQGTELFPFFNSAFEEWFDRDENGVDYQCPPGVVGDEPSVDKLKREVQNHIALLDANVEGIYGAEVAFDVKLKLFRALSALQALEPLDLSEQSWYNNLASTPIGTFISFETNLKNAGTLTDIEAGQADQLNQQIKELREELQGITWYTLNGAMGAVITDAAQKSLYESKLAQLKTATASLANLLQGRHQNLLNQWNSLDALNEGIGSLHTVSAQNLKTANRLLLRRLTSPFSGFTANEIQTLQNIATQCSGTGGEGVFTARALLAEKTRSLGEYNDECISNPRIEREDLKSKSAAVLSIAPNPVDQLATVSLPASRDYTVLVVFDVYGREYQRIDLAEGQTVANFATAGMSPGVYFLAAAPRMDQVLKFVVSR